MEQRSSRPAPDEYNEYFGRYIDSVRDGDVVATLTAQIDETLALLASVPAEREEYRYAPGKWSLREVVGHLIDTESAFAFRALWVARQAAGGQPSFEQDDWARSSNAGDRELKDLMEEWQALRRANVLKFAGFDGPAWMRRGRVSGNEVTTRALVWVIAGHELYHRALLERDYLQDSA